MMKRLCFLLSMALLACVSIEAQEITAQLKVSVSDPDSAVIPGARVTVDQMGCECGECPPEKSSCPSKCCECKNDSCRCCIVGLAGQTDEDGVAIFTVNSGLYRARVEVTGFKDTEVENIQVSVGQAATVHVVLSVGGGTPAPPTPTAVKAFTVRVSAEAGGPLPGVMVRVRKLGCVCGPCPANSPCAGGCCSCSGGDCECCVDVSEVTDDRGLVSVEVPPGEYEVRFSIAGKSFGTLSGVGVGANRAGVKLLATISAGDIRK
jgi:hypothetical protein